MIEVKVRNGSIEVSGHANYGPEGYDIVCASISTLFLNLINSMETLTEDQIKYNIEPGDSWLKYKRDLSDRGRVLIDSFFSGCCWISDEYPHNVQIV